MDPAQVSPDWIAVWWGAKTIHAWAMSADGQDVAQVTLDNDLHRNHNDAEAVLLGLLDPWLGARSIPVVTCGEIGGPTGLVHAKCANVPCHPPNAMSQVKTASKAIDLHIIAGVQQTKPADLMHGPETQIAGFLHLNPNWDGVVCLPDAQTTWALVSAGEIVSFQTFMTGPLLALLSEHSVLGVAVGSDWNAAAFDDAVSDALSRPEATAARLFNIYAEAVVNGTGRDWGTSRLAGLLIGAELAAARPYWLGQSVAVIGGQPSIARYAAALAAQGVFATQADAAQMALAGIKAIYAKGGTG